MMMKKQNPRSGDPTSRLPTEILHEIQRCLSPKSAIRSSLFSRPWLEARSTTPYLIFDDIKIHHKSEFLRFVHTTLSRYRHENLPIQSFKILSSSLDQHLLDKWVNILAEKRVSLFSLFKRFSQPYDLPDSIFAMESLEHLELNNCKILNRNDNVLRARINCRNLKTLVLRDIGVSESALHCLISSCPRITTITLDRCFGFSKIRLVDIANNLLSLHIAYSKVEQIHLEAPKLSHFVYEAVMCKVRLPRTLNVDTCRNLSRLRLENTCIDDTLICNVLLKLPIKELILRDCEELMNMKISSLTLEHCKLDSCSNLKQASFYAPKLQFLQVSTCEEVPLIILQRHSTRCRVELQYRFGKSASLFIKLKRCLSELITRPVYLSLELEEMDKCSIDLFNSCLRTYDTTPQVEDLQLMLNMQSEVSCYSTYFDAIFWTCWPKRLTIDCFACDTKFIQLLSKLLLEKRHVNSCDWKGYLVNNRIEYKKLSQSKVWVPLEKDAPSPKIEALIHEGIHEIRITTDAFKDGELKL